MKEVQREVKGIEGYQIHVSRVYAIESEREDGSSRNDREDGTEREEKKCERDEKDGREKSEK